MSDSSELGSIIHELSNAFAVDFSQPHSPMSGASHYVWLIDHPTNGETWSIRIAKNEFAASLSDRGTAILRYLKEKRPMLQVPRLLCQSKQYSVFQYLGGEPIDYWDSNKLSDQRRRGLLDGLAVFLFEMWTCPVPRGGEFPLLFFVFWTN